MRLRKRARGVQEAMACLLLLNAGVRSKKFDVAERYCIAFCLLT